MLSAHHVQAAVAAATSLLDDGAAFDHLALRQAAILAPMLLPPVGATAKHRCSDSSVTCVLLRRPDSVNWQDVLAAC